MHASLLALLALIPLLVALPAPSSRSSSLSPSKRIPIKHTSSQAKRYSPITAERQAWLQSQAAKLRNRYSTGFELVKRKESTTELQDLDYDTSYAAEVSIGTPAQSQLLALDTGSSDLWVIDSSCTASFCSGLPSFDSSASSTFTSSGAPFAEQYGSGNVSGTLAKDTVSLGGFTHAGQTLAVIDNGSGNLLSAPQSGLLGLAWGSIAEEGTPFWLNLVQSGQESMKEFGFFLARYQDDQSASVDEKQGGEFTLGGVDSSRLSSSINYIASAKDYWRIPLQSVTVDGEKAAGVSNRQSVIDTGTSLIAAQPQDIDAIYSLIPGSIALGGDLQGFVAFPCSENPSVSLKFGGKSYSISTEDFNLGAVDASGDYCAGAIFALDLGPNSGISWVVGDTFLKNVYSVFRYSPPAVGFATLG